MQSIHGTLAASAPVNEVQRITITGTPDGGTFTLTYDGQTTTAIAFNADAAAVDAALEALSNIGAGDVTASAGPLPGTAVDVAFTGALAATNVSQMTADGSLTGGTTPAVAVTTVTQGVSGVVTTVNLGQDAQRVQVMNRNGTAEIFFRTDGVDPTIEGEDTFCLPAVAGATMWAETRSTGAATVRLVSTGATKFSVMADI